MKKVIVYFHGYKSSPSSDKVRMLETVEDSRVYAFTADINPVSAIVDLSDRIDNAILDNLGQPLQIIFVGVGLGGWMAATLAQRYECECFLVNPCHSPRRFLPEEVVERSLYADMPRIPNAMYWFSADDLITPSVQFQESLDPSKVSVVNASHRFSSGEFQSIVDSINKL